MLRAGSAVLVVASVIGLFLHVARGPRLDVSPWEITPALLDAEAPATGPVASVARIRWSADGTWLLALSRGDVGREGALMLHPIETGDPPLAVDTGGREIASADLAPDARHVLAGTFGGELLWIAVDSSDRRALIELPERLVFCAASVSPDGRWAAGATGNGLICVGRTEEDEYAPRFLAGHRGGVRSLCFSADGRRLLSGGQDGTARVWDLASGLELMCLTGHAGPVNRALFLDAGTRVLSASHDGTMRLWDAGQTELWQVAASMGAVTALSVLPDGTLAASGAFETEVRLWDLAKRNKTRNFRGHTRGVSTVEFAPHGRWLAAGGLDGTIWIWNVKTGTDVAVITVGRK